MVLVQKWPFFQLFILGNIGQEDVFYDILEQKSSFYSIKTTSSKSRKSDIFAKGLSHGFGPKMAIFPKGLTRSFGPKMAIFSTFFFRKYRAGKFFLRYFRAKKSLSRLWKREVQKVEKLTFFQRENPTLTHNFGPKNGHFSNFFLLWNIA